jgi:hypothetical protein
VYVPPGWCWISSLRGWLNILAPNRHPQVSGGHAMISSFHRRLPLDAESRTESIGVPLFHLNYRRALELM